MDKRNETPEQKELRLAAFERDLRPVRKTTKYKCSCCDKIFTLENDKIEYRKCPCCDKLFILGEKCNCGFSGKGIDIENDTNWQLTRVDDIEWKQDDSGICVYINWDVNTDSVRLDIMAEADAEPLQSFAGKADNVRKAAMRWFAARISQKAGLGISLEHAAYIGSELERCDTERIDYVQD